MPVPSSRENEFVIKQNHNTDKTLNITMMGFIQILLNFY